MAGGKRPYGKLLAFGATSVALYALLFANQDWVMANYTRTDGFYWLLPVVTAFVFSLVHGGFTSYFWDVMGIHGKEEK